VLRAQHQFMEWPSTDAVSAIACRTQRRALGTCRRYTRPRVVPTVGCAITQRMACQGDG